LAERWCWQVARSDDARVARRLYRKQGVDGVYRLDEGALLDDFLPFLPAIGLMALLEHAGGTAIQRAMLPCMPSVVRYGLKPLGGIKSMQALPSLLCSDEARRPLVGFKAPQVRAGVCPRGATTRQAEREPGPIGPDTLAHNMVPWPVRDLEGVFNGAIRALAKAGAVGPKVTGLIDGPARETTERDRGCGQVTRTVRIEDTRGKVPAIAVTVYGWNVRLLSAALTKIPLAVKVGKIQAPATHGTRALVTQARANRAGHARRHKVVFERGCLDGTALWWLDQPGLGLVVPAKANMAVTADARAQAAAGAGMTPGRRVHTVRQGQGRAARTARLETAVGGLTGLTTDDQ
jgi:hypothetical protein